MRGTSAARRPRGRTARLAVLLAAALALVLTAAVPGASATAYPSPAGGTRQVVGAIDTHYRALGGPAGVLGGPLTGELVTPSGIGRYTLFAGGSIYWSPASKAWSVRGAIRDTWAARGWETGTLGYPTSDERRTPDGRGRYGLFQGGAVYWTSSTGAHQVIGSIWKRYGALGWETSVLGFPTTDELRTPNGIGRYNLFQGGSIYWSPGAGAHAVHGAIRDRWAAAGWENSALGFPTSDEYAVSGGRAQDFQRGTISWTPAGGTVVSTSVLPLGAAPAGNQLITVVAPSPTSTTAALTAWQRGPHGWTPVLGPIPARVGAAGIGAAREGSTKTPAGMFGLTEAFGRAADPGTALPYRRVDGDDWWVSDVASPRYNTYAQCTGTGCDFNRSAGEDLYAAGSVYDHAVVIDYNRSPVVRGAGSAFFLHIANASATAGCVAVDRASLQRLMRWLHPAAAPVIAIGVG